MTPEFFVEGRKGILDPLEIVSVPLDALGPCVASLAAEGEAMVAALYEVLSRA